MSPSKNFRWTDQNLIQLRYHPHLLGHICGKDRLTEIHSDWIRYIWEAEEDRSLQGHRGSYKTTAVCVIGPIWWWLFHPEDRIAIMRKTFTASAEVVQNIQLLMKKPELKSLFEYAHGEKYKPQIARYGKAQYTFKKGNTPEPSIQAHGCDYSMTGLHYDKVIADDIITLKDRVSVAERRTTQEVINEVRTNILDPGKPFCVTGTPWHERDAWSILPEPRKYTVDDTGILSQEEIEEKKRKTTPLLYSVNYELEHTSDEEQIFKNPFFGPWSFRQRNSVAQLDAAYDGDHHCALTIMSELPEGGYQAVGWVYQGNVKDWIEEIVEKCKEYRVTVLYNETNPDKGYTAEALKRKGVSCKTYQESQNKHIKITTYGYEVWPNIRWAPETQDEYMEQVLDYREKQEPDDAPDSFASLVREAYKNRRTDKSVLYRL